MSFKERMIESGPLVDYQGSTSVREKQTHVGQRLMCFASVQGESQGSLGWSHWVSREVDGAELSCEARWARI
jgi:hypothetical protein